jgi:Leucine-rich repeat (LRR) protein
MNQLRSLSLSQNQFTGTLPIELGELSNLRYLNIAENSFRGQMQESMVGNFTKLEILSLEQNNFTGTLPRSFGYLSSLGALNYTWIKHGIDIGQ